MGTAALAFYTLYQLKTEEAGNFLATIIYSYSEDKNDWELPTSSTLVKGQVLNGTISKHTQVPSYLPSSEFKVWT